MKLSAEVQMFAIALILVTFLAVALAVVALREMPQEDEQESTKLTPEMDQLAATAEPTEAE